MDVTNRNLGDYLAVLRRRWATLFAAALAVLVVGLQMAYLLPPVYQSVATILIEQQEIPPDLVGTAANTYADQRLQIVSRRVMTSANLKAIVRKYGLYTRELQKRSLDSVITQMRDRDIKMAVISADVNTERGGKPVQVTIAFTLSYENGLPKVTQRVASELVSLYLNENVKTRTEQAAEISGFLRAEVRRLETDVASFESRLATFKEQNVGRLPELATLNMQILDRSQAELQQVGDQLRSLEQQRMALDSQAAQLEASVRSGGANSGSRTQTPAERLVSAQNEYAALTAKYSPDHPDVIRMKKELESLRSMAGAAGGTSTLRTELDARRAELAELQQRYSADHPEVRQLVRQIEELEKQMTLSGNSASVAERSAVSNALLDSPSYIQIKSNSLALEAEMRTLSAKESQLRAKVAAYEDRLSRTPQIERQYFELSRGYDAALAKLREMQSKDLSAQLAQNLESKQKGERYTLIEPPLVPDLPARPNRRAIAFLALVFSIAGGLGAVALAEAMDRTVRGGRRVAAILHAPPLVVVPIIPRRAKRRRPPRRAAGQSA